MPKDLQGYYLTRKISYSLRAKPVRIARSRAILAAARLGKHWYQQRLGQTPVIAQHLLQPRLGISRLGPAQNSIKAISVQEATCIYKKLNGKGKSKTSMRAVGCPGEIVDEVGGWSKRSIGQEYDTGHSLNCLNEWIEKLLQ